MSRPEGGPRRRHRSLAAVGRVVASAKTWFAAVARSLPPPRDRALVDLVTAARTLVSGRKGTIPRGLDTDGDPLAVLAARAALLDGRADVAHERAADVLRRHPDNPGALDVDRVALVRLGELSAATRASRRLLRVRPDPAIARWERGIVGRLVETDPTWLPRVPGRPHRIDPASVDRPLHLLKESLPWRQNGYTMRTRYTLAAQRAAGLDPVVVTALGFPRDAGAASPPVLEEVDGIPHHRLDLGPAYERDLPFDARLADQAWLTARLARTVRPALLHAHSGARGYDQALVALAVGRHLDLPVVYEVRSFLETTWGMEAGVAEEAEYFRRRHATETRAMREAAAVITIADAMRDEIVDRGIAGERVFVIPNGVDASRFQPRPRDADLARRVGTDGRFAFGYVSNLDHPRENQELLLEATRTLRARGRAVRCLIVGEGTRRERLEMMARRLGVADDVIFTGAVPHDEVADYYGLMDAFVVPRRDERAARYVTPLKPFEAMALGRPLIVADLPALTEIAAPDDRGLAFRPGDAGSLADTIERVMDGPDLATEIAARARAWVASERTWAANGPRYRAVYDLVLSGHARAA